MEDLTAKFQVWSDAGSVAEVHYISFMDVGTFQLNNKADALSRFLNYISCVLVLLQVSGYCQTSLAEAMCGKAAAPIHCRLGVTPTKPVL